MGKGLLFFCCSCCILVLTIINLSIGPIITGRTDIEGTMNCARLNDYYDQLKDAGASNDDLKYTAKWSKDECLRKKGMHDMEYTAFIFDIVIGFVCGLIGLLHLFDLKKDFVSNTGLIGLGCGFVGFILTFVYIIFNGLVYTNYYDDNRIIKRDGDGIFAELEGDKYKCKYFDEEGNTHALIAKYSDLGKKQYNYEKKRHYPDDNDEFDKTECKISISDANDGCANSEHYSKTLSSTTFNNCKYLYLSEKANGFGNKYLFDRWVTTIIFSCFIIACCIGLAIFGFLLFQSNGSGL